MYPNDLTPEQVQNLVTLAAFLDRAVPPPTFDMSCFIMNSVERVHAIGVTLVLASIQSAPYGACGTSACAVGHGPLAGIPALKDEQWMEYAGRCFGADCNGFSTDFQRYYWLFHESWASVDNTPRGAAARIRWYLKNGVPDNAYAQMRGKERLCYTNMISPEPKDPIIVMETPTE